ncbi:uncharacterized protein FPRN_11451 [Fusarium proliferatum]|nr:uncharacterized protein FPRN_11451 [Fusarium proliferatum]
MVKVTKPNVCDCQRAGDFIEADPLVSLFESSKRFEYTKQLEATIHPPKNLPHPFSLSIESCLIDGRTYGGNNHHEILETLKEIPPFCRHYMMNLGAADVAPEFQPYLLRDNEPQPTYSDAPYVSNPRTLGGSDKRWNQLCLDPELFSLWAKGYCAFKFMGSKDISEGKGMATLQFRWMPQIKKRSGTTMNIHGTGSENDWLNLMAELDTFHSQYQPPPTIGDKTLRATTKAGAPLRSGHLIHICLPKEDVECLEVVISLQRCGR